MPWLEAGFYQQTLFAQDWVCLANARASAHCGKRRMSLRRAYQAEAHIGIVSGTGHQLLDSAAGTRSRVDAPGACSSCRASWACRPIVSTTDLIATLPRHIGETLARAAGLQVLRLPAARFRGFTVKQHWHARYHHDAPTAGCAACARTCSCKARRWPAASQSRDAPGAGPHSRAGERAPCRDAWFQIRLNSVDPPTPFTAAGLQAEPRLQGYKRPNQNQP